MGRDVDHEHGTGFASGGRQAAGGAAVSLGDLAHQAQPQAYTLGAGRHERLEDPLGVGGSNARAGVADQQAATVRRYLRAKRDAPAGR